MLGHLDQVREQLDTARREEHRAKKLLAAGERVLTKVIEEKKKLQDSNTKLGGTERCASAASQLCEGEQEALRRHIQYVATFIL